MDKGLVTADEATFPDLGELPPTEELSSGGSEGGDNGDEDEDDDDNDGEGEENDEEGDDDDRGSARRRKSRQLRIGRKQSLLSRKDRDHDKDDETHKKRGRPPMVLTPMEGRISSILKGLRKLKNRDGGLLVIPFEKLPDKTSVADYYQKISNPIALDNIKKKAKRKKYRDVDQVLADIELMFNNAKLYNEDGSEIYQAAVELQQQARLLAEQEKSRPDDDFRDEDGKLPLAEIQHNSQSWKVGKFHRSPPRSE